MRNKRLLITALAISFVFAFTINASAVSVVSVKSPTANSTYLAGNKVPVNIYAEMLAYGYDNYVQVQILKGSTQKYFSNTKYSELGTVTPAKKFTPKTAGTYTLKTGLLFTNDAPTNTVYNVNKTVKFKVIKPAKIKSMKPKLTAKRDSNGYASISCSNIPNGAKMKVYRATSKNGKYKLVKTVSKSEWTDKKASKKKAYYYKVIWTAKSGSKTYKSKYSAKRKVAKFSNKLTLNAKLTSSGNVKLTWSGASYEYYLISRGTTNNGAGEVIACMDKTDTSYIDKDVVKGKTYYYRITSWYGNEDKPRAKSTIKKIKVQ